MIFENSSAICIFTGDLKSRKALKLRNRERE